MSDQERDYLDRDAVNDREAIDEGAEVEAHMLEGRNAMDGRDASWGPEEREAHSGKD